MREILKQLYPAVAALILFTVICGLVYPLVITGVAQMIFPHEANGSILTQNGHPAGSELIGQPFSDQGHFWGRPSATSPFPYNSAASSGSNLAPTNPDLTTAVSERVRALKEADPGNNQPIPIDLVTSSGSGLDPHISPEAAEYQVPRVARVRRLPVEEVQRLVREYTEDSTWGILGEPRVNVLRLNQALDTLSLARNPENQKVDGNGTHTPQS
jgi:K+-transporting ATPase ATPase C chain